MVPSRSALFVSVGTLVLAVLLTGGVRAGDQSSLPQLPGGSGAIEGRVLDRSGDGIPGGTVTARLQGIGAVHTATTGVRGRFRLVLPAGRYVVHFGLNGFDHFRQTGVDVRTGVATALDLPASVSTICECIVVEASPLKFSMPVAKPATLRGAATDSKGNPLPYAEISLLGGGYFDPYLTGAKGQFAAEVPSERNYTIKVRYPGFAEATVDLRLSPGQARVLPIVLMPTEEGDAAPTSRKWGFGCRCGHGAFTHYP